MISHLFMQCRDNGDWDAMRLPIYYRKIPVVRETDTMLYVDTPDVLYKRKNLAEHGPSIFGEKWDKEQCESRRIRKADLEKGFMGEKCALAVRTRYGPYFYLEVPKGAPILEENEEVGALGFDGWHDLNPKLNRPGLPEAKKKK